MPMYTHDDCYFADDAPSGACEGPVFGPVMWNLDAMTEDELVRYRATMSIDILCDRHRAMGEVVDWDMGPIGADEHDDMGGGQVDWHQGEIDLANVRI